MSSSVKVTFNMNSGKTYVRVYEKDLYINDVGILIKKGGWIDISSDHKKERIGLNASLIEMYTVEHID